jgi:hypothetical protein
MQEERLLLGRKRKGQRDFDASSKDDPTDARRSPVRPADSVPDFVSVVVSRSDVESGDISQTLAVLNTLLQAPESARRYFERVHLAFHGYDHTTAEVFEIEEVRNFVFQLDDEFPYWLFFLTKHTTSLQAITLCQLPPFLSPAAKAEIFPGRLQSLLLQRWIPAMNEVSEFAGLSEQEVDELTDRSVQYIQSGPLPIT